MRYCFLRFPEGKPKALTLSYDDGVIADKRFSDIITSKGIKCTFNINSSLIGRPGRIDENEIKEYILDRGHEVAVHGSNHIAPGISSPSLTMIDILDCRRDLEKRFGMIIRGMAYPDSGITSMHNSNTYENIKSILTNAGIVYSRTLAGDNPGFALPSDFHAWMPTAHHNNPSLFEWADKFLALDPSKGFSAALSPKLFYLWGHSYEFDNNANWNRIEEFCDKMSGKDDIWYATNIEIYEYIEAYNSLVFSVDCERIYNPTLKEIFLYIDYKNYSIKPGETLTLG